MRAILDANGDVVSVIEHDEINDKTIIASYQDTSPYIERNRELAKEDNPYLDKEKTLRRAASIPVVVYEKLLRESGIRPVEYMRNPRAFHKWLRQKVNDPDYSGLRTGRRAR